MTDKLFVFMFVICQMLNYIISAFEWMKIQTEDILIDRMTFCITSQMLDSVHVRCTINYIIVRVRTKFAVADSKNI